MLMKVFGRLFCDALTARPPAPKPHLPSARAPLHTTRARARSPAHAHARTYTHTQPAENPDGVPVPATEPLLQLDAGDGTSALAVVLPQVPRPAIHRKMLCIYVFTC